MDKQLDSQASEDLVSAGDDRAEECKPEENLERPAVEPFDPYFGRLDRDSNFWG